VKNLIFLFCLVATFTLNAQNEDYAWTEMDTTYTDEFELEELDLPVLPDLSLSFYAPLQTGRSTLTFDIPIQNKGLISSKACELQLLHKFTTADGQIRKIQRAETIPALAPGELYTLRIQIKDRSFRQPAISILSTFIFVDRQELISEQDETNNVIRYVPTVFSSAETMEEVVVDYF
jgi:hypothetical protein